MHVVVIVTQQQIIRQAIIYVIAIDAFVQWETEAHAKIVSLHNSYVIVMVTWQEMIRKKNNFYVCNVSVDDGNWLIA